MYYVGFNCDENLYRSKKESLFYLVSSHITRTLILRIVRLNTLTCENKDFDNELSIPIRILYNLKKDWFILNPR